MKLMAIKSFPVLSESVFSTLHYSKKDKILYYSPKEEKIIQMMSEDYQEECKKIAEVCTQNRPIALLLNTTNFNFPIAPELQTWTNETIFSKKSSLKKCAVLRSSNFIGDLSLEQTFDKNEATFLSFQVQFFGSIASAIHWVKSSNE